MKSPGTSTADLKPYEKYIRHGAYASFEYASKVVGGEWPEGEAAIATDSHWAWKYVSEIKQRPWPEGEEAIAQDIWYKIKYGNLLDAWGQTWTHKF